MCDILACRSGQNFAQEVVVFKACRLAIDFNVFNANLATIKADSAINECTQVNFWEIKVRDGTNCLVPLATSIVNSEDPDTVSVEQSAFRETKSLTEVWAYPIRYKLLL